MKKHKRVFAMPGYISFIKDRLPLYEHHEWMGLDTEELKNEWKVPEIIPLLFRTPVEKTKKKEKKVEKEGEKQKLNYTTEEVRKAKEEDKETLKDVEKIEEHLEEDVEKAEKKLKK
jgi:hypothetical protein